MKPEQAKELLLNLIMNGRLIMNGLPLTAREIAGLHQATLSLYDQAKELEESKQAAKNPKPKEPK